MPASKIDICNMALAHLGMKGISSLSQNDPSAIACNNFFNSCRDDVLSEYKWPFANSRTKLSLVSDEVIGWDYVYLYPITAARVWNVFDESTVNNKDEQEFEVVLIPSSSKRVVCSNLADAYADCTYKTDDSSIYDPKFTIALSYRLAAAMANTLTGDADTGIKLMNVYGAVLSEAKRLSSVEKIKKPSQTSSYVNSRG